MSLNKYTFNYSIFEEFVAVKKPIRQKIKMFKLKKYFQNQNNFGNNKKELFDITNTELKPIFDKYKVKLKDCWIQKYTKNDYHDLHTHGVKGYSFVWYIKIDDKSASLQFFDIGYPYINTEQTIAINAKDGLFLIFPSFIPHAVPKNLSKERLVISGNVF